MGTDDIQCVIFDCQGTLIDSERLTCIALVRIFNQMGACLSVDDLLPYFSGGKTADILLNTCRITGISADIDQLEKLYRQELDHLFLTQLKPMAGAVRLLDYLSQQGIEYCVTSNAPYEKMWSDLTLAGLAPYFTGRVFSAFEANSWKPEPDLVRYCAMRMGFALQNCLYVDDTKQGVEAGIQAGVMSYQLCSPIRVQQQAHPQARVIQHLEQLEAVIDEVRLSQP